MQAGYSKHKWEDVLPLRSDLANLLRGWMADKPVGQWVWSGAWRNKAAEMVQADLRAAKEKWVGSGQPRGKSVQGEQSGRFAYCDADGRFFDFHRLRVAWRNMGAFKGLR